MSEFDSEANLSITVANSELRSVREQIESELQDIELGVTASVSGGGQMQRQPRDPTTGQFMAIEGVEQRVIEQTEQQVELLDDIKDALEGGNIMAPAAAGDGGGRGGILSAIGLGRVAGFGAGAAGLGGTAGTIGAAVGIPAAASLGTGALFQELFGAEVTEDSGPTAATRDVELTNLPDPWPPELQVPEGFPPQIQTPEGFPPELQVPKGIPPELQVPDGIPPELQVPEGVPPELQLPEGFPPQIEVPEDFPPELEVPGFLRDIFGDGGDPGGETVVGPGGQPFRVPGDGGGFNIDVNVAPDITVDQTISDAQNAIDRAEELANDAEETVEDGLDQLERRIQRELE